MSTSSKSQTSGMIRVQEDVSLEATVTHLVPEKVFVIDFLQGDTTPGVIGGTVFRAGNDAPVDITFFKHGSDGKSIRIIGDGFTTVKHDVDYILTNVEEDKLLTEGRVYLFTFVADNTAPQKGRWVEQTGGGSGGGSTVPGSGALVFNAVDPIAVNRVGNTITHSFTGSAGSAAWADITGKPATFPPDPHAIDSATHTGTLADTQVVETNVTQHQAALSIAWSQLTGVPATFPPDAHAHDFGDLTGIPSAFPPLPHVHDASDITTGLIDPALLPVPTREVVQFTTPSVVDTTTISNSFDLEYKSAHFIKITSNRAGTLVLYSSQVARDGDAYRTLPPLFDAVRNLGTLGEFIFSDGGNTFVVGPPILLFSTTVPANTTIYYRWLNSSGTNGTTTFDLTIIGLE